MKRHIVMILGLTTLAIATSCSTSEDLETVTPTYANSDGAISIEQEQSRNLRELESYYINEKLKTQDVEDTVVYIDRPVYVPEQKDVPELERGNLKGHDAVVDSVKRATMSPSQYIKGTFNYQYDDNLVYEIYAQPYHLTDIMLEPGEIVKGVPLISEDESVWELTANISIDAKTGQDVQHLFIKPAYSKQDSTMIIITDRRVYHFRIKSYSDTHMAIVKFTYPNKHNIWASDINDKNGRGIELDFIRFSNPELLSFDYKMKYSIFRKPEFLPKRVYDDGQMTYIQVNPLVLQKKLPVLFNEKNEIENYSVQKNVFIVPRLINKMTLRLGKGKVTIEKKRSNIKDLIEDARQEGKEEGIKETKKQEARIAKVKTEKPKKEKVTKSKTTATNTEPTPAVVDDIQTKESKEE